MFSRFFRTQKQAAGTQSPSGKEALDTRGLEINEGDQDTAWSLWDSAVADKDPGFNAAEIAAIYGSAGQVPLPTLAPLPVSADLAAPTQPTGLTDRQPENDKNDALRLIEEHHPRVAQAIKTMWGYKECSDYIAKLMMSGNDDSGRPRAGFHQDAAEAMLYLADLHDAEFGFNANAASGSASTTQGKGRTMWPS
jgi:hypothetical protein